MYTSGTWQYSGRWVGRVGRVGGRLGGRQADVQIWYMTGGAGVQIGDRQVTVK